MKKIILAISIVMIVLAGAGSRLFATEQHKPEQKESHAPHDEHGHDHGEEESEDEHDHEEGEHDDHGDEHGAGEAGHEEGGHEEGASPIGPDKGILAKSKKGIQLSPEAYKSFGIVIAKLINGNSVPKDAIVAIKDKKYIYTVTDGWIKKIRPDQATAGMDIVVAGVGFLRIAELIAEEGAAHSH